MSWRAGCGSSSAARTLVLAVGEAIEFDTSTPHGFANAADTPTQLLMLMGPQGERSHLRTVSSGTPPDSAAGSPPP